MAFYNKGNGYIAFCIVFIWLLLVNSSSGAVISADSGSSAAPGFTFIGDTDTGFYRPAADTINVALGSDAYAKFTFISSLEGTLVLDHTLAFGDTVDTPDIFLTRTGIGNLEMRSGVTPQSFFIYNTYSGASDYERGKFQWSSDNFIIGTEYAGSGTFRDFYLRSANDLYLGGNAGNQWKVTAAGHFLANIDNNYSIGLTNANRPTFISVSSGGVYLGEPSGGLDQIHIKSPSLSASYQLIYPADDGASGQVLTTDGSGNLTWSANGGSGQFISWLDGSGTNINAYASTVLKVPIIINGLASHNTNLFEIKNSSGNIIYYVSSNALQFAFGLGGQGTITASNLIVKGSTALQLVEGAGTDKITIIPPSLSSSYNLTLPGDDGDNGEVLTTDGSGNLSWETASGSVDGNLYVASTNGNARTLTASNNLASEVSLRVYGQANNVADIFQVFSNATKIVNVTSNGILVLNSDAGFDRYRANVLRVNQGNSSFGGLILSNLFFVSADDTNEIRIISPSLTAPYTLTLPVDNGNSGESLITDGNGALSWSTNAIGPFIYTQNGLGTNLFLRSSSVTNIPLKLVSIGGTGTNIFEAWSNTLRVATINSNGYLTVGQAVGPNASYRFGGDTDTYIYNIADGVISLFNNGVDTHVFTTTEYANLSDSANISFGVAGDINIRRVSAGNLRLDGETGTSTASLTASNLTVKGATALNIVEGSGSEKIIITVPSLGANYTLTLPVDDGDSGQVLGTDGSGNLEWVDTVAGSFVVTLNGLSTNLLSRNNAPTSVPYKISALATTTTNLFEIVAGVNRVFSVNSNGTFFALGTTNGAGSPAFKVSGNSIQARFSDDSDYAAMDMAKLILNGLVRLENPSAGNFKFSINSDDGLGSITLSNITTSGSIWAAAGTKADPSYSWVTDTDSGFYRNGNGIFSLSLNNVDFARFDLLNSRIALSNAVKIGWSATDSSAAPDVGLVRSGISSLRLDGTTGTGTGSFVASNITVKGSSAIVLVEGSGTDSISITVPTLTASYALTLPTDDGAASQVLTTDGSGGLSWQTVTTSGFIPSLNGSGTNLVVRNSSVTSIPLKVIGIASTTTNLFEVLANATQVFTVNSNGSMVRFGSGASLPAIKIPGNYLQVRLADDSDYAAIDAAKYILNGDVRLENPSSGNFKLSIASDDGRGSITVSNLTAAGSIWADEGTKSAPGISWVNDTDSGFYRTANGVFGISLNNTDFVRFDQSNSRIVISNNVALGWSILDSATIPDVSLVRSAIGTLTLNGTNGVAKGFLIASNITVKGAGAIQIVQGSGSNKATIEAPAVGFSASYTLRLPVDDGTGTQLLQTDGSGNLSWIDPTSIGGDVTGPSSATDNAIARFDGTTGKIIQNSSVSVLDGTRGAMLFGPNTSGTGFVITNGVNITEGHHVVEFRDAVTDNPTFLTLSVGAIMIGTNMTFEPTGVYHAKGELSLFAFNNGGVAGSGALSLSNLIVRTGSGGGVSFREENANGNNIARIIAPSSLAANYTLTLPNDDGGADEILSTDGNGNLFWTDISSLGGGDVSGPASSTDNAIARFDSTTGKIIQNSGVIVSDTGTIATALGTVAAPSYSFLGDLDTGIYSPSAGQVQVAINGVASTKFTANTIESPFNTFGFVVGSASDTRLNRFSAGVWKMDGPAAGDGRGFLIASNIIVKSGPGGALVIGASNTAQAIKINAPALGADVTLTLPNSDGEANEVLTTDGSGNLSWAIIDDLLTSFIANANGNGTNLTIRPSSATSRPLIIQGITSFATNVLEVLTVSGTRLTVINQFGSIFGPNGSQSNPTFSWINNPTTGFYQSGDVIGATFAGVGSLNFTAAAIQHVADDARLIFGSASDTRLTRSAAGVFQLDSTAHLNGLGSLITSNLMVNGMITYRDQIVLTNLAGSTIVFLPFETNIFKTVHLGTNNAISFHTTNRNDSIRTIVVKIHAGATVNNALSFDPAWVFQGVQPAQINSNKIAMLTLVLYGSSEGSVVAGYTVEQ